MIAFLILLSGAVANGSDLDTEIEKAKGNIMPNLDGTFLYKLDTGNEFVIDGDYTIQATYGNYTNTRTVTVPEFPMTGFILVASFMTILIITRTKWAQNKTIMVP